MSIRIWREGRFSGYLTVPRRPPGQSPLSLLLDENVSRRLAVQLVSPGLIHVRDVGLKQADDREIWQ